MLTGKKNGGVRRKNKEKNDGNMSNGLQVMNSRGGERFLWIEDDHLKGDGMVLPDVTEKGRCAKSKDPQAFKI